MLHMENTGLREIEPYFLQATGLNLILDQIDQIKCFFLLFKACTVSKYRGTI